MWKAETYNLDYRKRSGAKHCLNVQLLKSCSVLLKGALEAARFCQAGDSVLLSLYKTAPAPLLDAEPVHDYVLFTIITKWDFT